jgi:pyruvate dehydrogenase E2 component (dihydrolipoamide acetyltransferase)
MYEFKMPSLGTEMTHGKLLEWMVKVGDIVKRHDIVAVIDTDKAAIEIESFREGVVEKLIVSPGERIPVGTVMALIRESAATTEKRSDIPLSTAIKISPFARRLAMEKGVDIAKIKGSGPEGAIVKEDILKISEEEPIKEDHLTSMKKVITAAVTKSKREIPHYYLSSEIDLSLSLQWLEKYNSSHPITERLLYIALLIKAVVVSLKKYKEFNGYYIKDEYKPSDAIHIGMAISLREGGLIAPALLNADKMTLNEIMHSLTDLVTRARSGKLKAAEISDSTITITNLGDGVDSVFGVIYPPQVALIGFGRVSATKTIIATLSADHRVSNGHSGSRFLLEMSKLLQEPENLWKM